MEILKNINPTVLLLATIDTKGTEALYLGKFIKTLGIEPILIDLSIRPAASSILSQFQWMEEEKIDVSRIISLNSSKDMSSNMKTIVDSALDIARKLVIEGRVRGVIGIGGCTGTLMISSIMQSLPFGIPKVIVSAAAAQPGLSNQFLKTSDIMLFHSVIDIFGLSHHVKNILERAAYALYAMVHGPLDAPDIDRESAIAMTMMSTCEKCARSVQLALEKNGYHVIGFTANGIGDRVMEDMIKNAMFKGVIDLAPGGVGEHFYGYMRDAGPDRLENAGKMGLPQIISMCGVNHITPSRSKVTLKQGARRKYDLDSFRTWIRMTPKELKHVSKIFADKLNKSRGLVKIIIPLKGWSSVDSPGSPTYDPDEDKVFIFELRRWIKSDIEIIEVNANMEDPAFAKTIARVAYDLFVKKVL